MLRRDAESAFLPHVYVFPGGSVDDADADLAAALLGAGALTVAPALAVAAIREAFEEAGILFAADAQGRAARVDADDLAAVRAALAARTFRFGPFLAERGWSADARPLVAFSNWVTPDGLVRRFDTHFFVARSPEGQVAQACALETHDGVWVSPREALLRFAGATFPLIFVTIKHLERLLLFRDLEELFAFARAKPIRTVTPRIDAQAFFMERELEHRW